MSYDLMVFDPDSVPVEREDFLNWYEKISQWEESHDYNNPEVASTPLQDLFHDLIKEFPPMNGPFASNDVDNPKMSDYTIGRNFIYISFAWSESETAHKDLFGLAAKHDLGFFDVSSSDGKVWIPSGDGGLELISSDQQVGQKEKRWWQFWK